MINGNFNDLMIENIQMIDVIRRALKYIDTRLVDHGERVAFIATHIVKDNTILPELDIKSLYMLSLLHDIGAYKTEEITNMLNFETKDVDNHSIYGYVFLKYLSPLKDMARAILYHHLDYIDFKGHNDIIFLYSQIIFLADRIDIYSRTNLEINETFLRSLSNKFHPALIELFLENNKKFKIVERLKDESYINFIENNNKITPLSCSEIWSYLNMIVFSIDFRSESTVSHTVFTSIISVEIAKMLKLSDKELEEIYCGAFLHDLGKMAVPYTILEKPGSLTNDELTIMRTHVLYTEQIIKNLVNTKICNISSRHHEKLNGKGYPHGLTKNDLTLQERIVAIADIISALWQPRSYKLGFEKDKILNIMSEMANNGELDQDIMTIVMNNFDEIITAAKSHSTHIVELYKKLTAEFETLKNYKEHDLEKFLQT